MYTIDMIVLRQGDLVAELDKSCLQSKSQSAKNNNRESCLLDSNVYVYS